MHVRLISPGLPIIVLLAVPAYAAPEVRAAPAPVAQLRVEPTPAVTTTPNPLTYSAAFRSYYFTRQNASNNPGARFDFTPGDKYSATGVNQATWASAILLHGEYVLPGMGGTFVGGSYAFASPLDGPCSIAYPEHIKGQPCVSQRPPNTNPDDTLPGFTLDTFYEAYLGYRDKSWYAKAGDQLFASPWANPADTRLKPVAFQGADVIFNGVPRWTFETADMIQFENRTSNSFQSNTLLTSYPAGNSGLPANINSPGGYPIETAGFFYARASYGGGLHGPLADAYYYSVNNLMHMLWFDGRYDLQHSALRPFLELHGGIENNQGASYLGKIDSQVFGARIGANLSKNLLLTIGFDEMPWHSDTLVLPHGVSCNESTKQITAKGATLPYFLPLVNSGTGQCANNAGGTTTVYYGGWASPYTDNYTADPLFTTNGSQGMIERRAAGTAERVVLTYASNDKRLVVLGAYGRQQFGNGAAPVANTSEYDFDGTYRFSHYKGSGPYRGLMLRDRYFVRTIGNTYCGASNATCPAGLSYGDQYLGGLPLFTYNRAQLEYDF